MPKPRPYIAPDISRVSVSDLSPLEKDKLLQAILDHLGREIEVVKWDGDAERGVNLVKPYSR